MATKFSKYLKTCFALGSLSLGLTSVIASATDLTSTSYPTSQNVVSTNPTLTSSTNTFQLGASGININHNLSAVSYIDTQVTDNHNLALTSSVTGSNSSSKADSFSNNDYQAADKDERKTNDKTNKSSTKTNSSKDKSTNSKSVDKNADNSPKANDKADSKVDNKTDNQSDSKSDDKATDDKSTASGNAVDKANTDLSANVAPIPTNTDSDNAVDPDSIKKLQSNIDDWQKQVDELNASKNKTLAETTRLANLQQAINFGKQALATYQTIEQYQKSVDDLKNQVDQAKSNLAEEQKQLDNFHNTASNDKQLKQQSIDLNKAIDDIKAKIAALKPAETSINTLLLDNGKLLSDVNKQLSATDLEESNKLKLTAEKEAIIARNNLLKKKQNSANLITTTNAELTDLYNQQIVLIQKQLEAVNQAYKQQELAQKQAEINKNPILAAENIINESLKTQLENLNKEQANLQTTLTTRQEQLSDAKRVSTTIDSQIKLLQGTLELNRLINEQKTLLPNISNAVDYSKDIINWRVTSFQLQAQLQQIKSEKDYIQNISPASLINSLQTLAPGSNSVSTILQIQEQASNISDDTKKQLIPILTARKEMLAKIIDIYANIIDVSTKIDTAQDDINTIIKSINDKLNQQDFFVRSTPPVTSSWIKSFTYSAKVQLSGLSEKFTLKVGEIEIYIFGIVLLIIGWIVSRQKRWINFHLDKLRNRINIRNKDNILVTPLAILLTFVRTLDKPLIWGGVILLITNSIFVDQGYIYDYFTLIIEFILVYNFTVALVMRGGIVNCHYSPEGSFYAKTANNDADLLNTTTVVPQPQVKAFPTKIFASSRTVQLIDFTFVAERKAYLKRVELNSGFEPVDEDHTLYVSPKEKQFEKARKERLENEAKLKQKREEEERKAKEKALAEELARLEAEEKAKQEEEARLASEEEERIAKEEAAKAQELAEVEAQARAKAQTLDVNGNVIDAELDPNTAVNTPNPNPDAEQNLNTTADSTTDVTNSTDSVTSAVVDTSNDQSENATDNLVPQTKYAKVSVDPSLVADPSHATSATTTNVTVTTTNATITPANVSVTTANITVTNANLTVTTAINAADNYAQQVNNITPDGFRNKQLATNVTTVANVSVTNPATTNVSVTTNISTVTNITNPQYNNKNSSELVTDDDGYSEIPPDYNPPVVKAANKPAPATVKPTKPVTPVKPLAKEDKPKVKEFASPQAKAQSDFDLQRQQLTKVKGNSADAATNAAKANVSAASHLNNNLATAGKLDDKDKHLIDEISKDLAKNYTPFPIYSVDQSSDGFITDNDEFEKACKLSHNFSQTSSVKDTNSTANVTTSSSNSTITTNFSLGINKNTTPRKTKKSRYANQKVCLSTDVNDEIQAKASRDLKYQLTPNVNQDAQAQVYDYQNPKRRSNSRKGIKYSSVKDTETTKDNSAQFLRVRTEVPQPMLYTGIDETLVTHMPGTPEYIREKYTQENSENVPLVNNPDLEALSNDPNANLVLGTHLDKEGNIRDIHGNILLTKEQIKEQQASGNIDLDMNNVNNINPNQNPTVDQADVHKVTDEEKNRQEKVWSSTPKDRYHYTEAGDKTDQVDKILEADKYFNLSDAPVHDQFMRNAEISDDLNYLFTHVKWILFFLINIIFFNIHPGVSPSENIFGQSLYLISMVILIVTVLFFARAYLKRRARRLEEINTKIKLFWWVVTMIPIVFFILVFEGYVNTTNILLDHAFYSFYALVIAFIFWRSIQRTFAIFSINIAAKNSRQGVNTTDSTANKPDGHHITNIYEEQRRALQDHHNAQRTAYFDNFVGLNKLANVISAIVLITVLLFVWSDLISVISYLNNITVWKVEGTTPGTTSDITLFSIFNSLLTIFITIIIYKNLKPLLDVLLFSRIKMAEGLPYAIETVLSYLVIALGFASSFSSLGLSWSKLQWLFSALLVGLGFGLQEIFANFVSGIIILFERPIRINDFVTINDVTGSIQNIRIRATTIIDPDNKEVIIPNKTFVTGQFINWSLSDTRTRLVYNIGVAYGSDIDLVTMTLLEAAEMCPLVIHEPNPPSCYFMEFGASSLNFVLRVHVKMLADRLITIHEINRNINNLCNERGINITFNQLDVFIKNGSGIDVKIDSSDLRTTNDTAKAAQDHNDKAANKGKPTPKTNNAKNKSDEYFDMVA